MKQNLRNLQYAFQRPSRGSAGFTIIEVMIVLVIAAVILLIVFLAVPALQRNSRNTQRKNAVARVAAATSEFRTNSGAAPVASSSATSGSDAESIFKSANTGQIITSLEVKNCTPGFFTICNEYDTGADDVAYVLLKSKCSNNVAIAASSSKEITVVYRNEVAKGNPQACLASSL